MQIRIIIWPFAAFTIIAACLVASIGSARSEALGSLEKVEIPLVAWVAQQDRARPDSIKDIDLPGKTITAFREMIRAVLNKKWQIARTIAQQIDYELIYIKGELTAFVVANDNSQTGLHPTIVINTAPKLNAIVGAPHAAFETGTAEQAALFVSLAGARAAIIAGAHRCASQTLVSCDGQTRVCGKREAYRTSDAAHNPNTLFHEAHIVLAKEWPKSVVVSLHGMREDRDGIKTSIIISHGYKGEDVKKNTPATRLRIALAKRFGSSGQVVSCDLSNDSKFRARKLCGYTNIQGRFVNDDSDVCKLSQTTGTNRFVHIEQDWYVLRPFDRAWASKKNDALITGFMRAASQAFPHITP